MESLEDKLLRLKSLKESAETARRSSDNDYADELIEEITGLESEISKLQKDYDSLPKITEKAPQETTAKSESSEDVAKESIEKLRKMFE